MRLSELKQALGHAFAVEPAGPAEPTPEERAVLDRLCAEVVRRRMTLPAAAFLEMSQPLNYLGAQTLRFFGPVVTAILDARAYETFAAYLERRGSIEWIVKRLDELEAERGDRT